MTPCPEQPKLIVRIYEAVADGISTAGEIAAKLNHQRASVSARLCQLEDDGVVVSTGRAPGKGAPKVYVRK